MPDEEFCKLTAKHKEFVRVGNRSQVPSKATFFACVQGMGKILAEKAAMAEQELGEIKTRYLELQPHRQLL